MADYAAPSVVTSVAVLAMLYKKFSPANGKNAIPFPPKPPARWFWSNALPSVNIACALIDLVREYGPVVSFRQGNQVIIVIGSVEATTTIMETEGRSLEMLSNGMRIVMAHSGECFRRLHKAVHTHLQPTAAEAYKNMQHDNARKFVLDILNDPKDHQKHAARYSASVILQVTYGKSTPTSYPDPEVIRIYKVLNHFELTMCPGAYLIDCVPLLHYLPGYGQQLTEWHNEELSPYRHQLGRVKSEMKQNKPSSSFTKTLLEHTKDHQLATDEMAYLAGTPFGAGADTTTVGITTAIMAVACHPLAQAKMHEELDMIAGSDRAPTFKDLSSLPQLHAFILEALRWRPVIPTGFPQCATRVIIWVGCNSLWMPLVRFYFLVPCVASLTGFVRAICRNPIAFPDPEKFDPQRWLDSDGRLKDNMKSFTFGFGRRVCPGRHLVENSMYIGLALLFWSFHIDQRPGICALCTGHRPANALPV
ncbi:cytochrome P450 [Suillus subluteus]|nr:cytochrome P450 [Suillus subluteus]